MARMDSIGAFGLTEPHGGSDVAGGMETTATRDGSGPDAEWILDGEKRWIGNATFADLIIVWAGTPTRTPTARCAASSCRRRPTA